MRILNKIEAYFCGTALILTSLIIFVNVVLRYVFHASTSWAEEAVKYLMIWITFIGGSICFRKGLHVSIDFFLSYISESARRIVAAAVLAVCLVFVIFMIYYGFRLVLFNFSTGQVSPALRLPMWIPYLAIPLGFLLMSRHIVAHIISLIKGGSAA
ncbi:MAG: C4-dicarboxylate ABC transporter substrate-binding protein [Dethiosulfovibrio peptidovorans]|nr:MAG: C4-dicarboxylate ABC transporter substrate-binding protein [Dethiosulfovibrio peptidovorans]